MDALAYLAVLEAPAWLLPETTDGPIIPNAAAEDMFPGFTPATAAEVIGAVNRRLAITCWTLPLRLNDRRRSILVAQCGHENRAGIALRAAGHVMFDWDMTSGRLDWFAHATKAMGYDTTHFPGTVQNWLGRIHPEDRPRIAAAVLSPVPPDLETWEEAYRFLRADGTAAHVIDRGFLLRDEAGQARRMIGTMIDVSAVHEAEARFQLATSASTDVLFIHDLVEDKIWWSDALFRQYGHADVPGVEKTDWWMSRVHPEDAPRLRERFEAARTGTDDHWTEEYRFARADGSYVWVVDRARFLRDADGRALRSVGSMVDMTALREGQERFRLAAEASQDVIYSWEPETGRTWRSESYSRTFGLDPFAPASGPGSWRAAIHPDDLPRILHLRDTAITRGDDRWEYAYRVIRGDGSVAHVIDRALAQRRPDGRLHRLIGSIVDVTRLREEGERLRAVLRLASDVVYEIDLRAGTVLYSEGAVAIFGAEWEGEQPSPGIWTQSLHPEDAPQVLRQFRTFIAGRREDWRAEYRLRRSDGSYAHVRDRALALRDDEGEAFRIVGAIEDITDEVELAAKLQQAQRLEALGKLTGGVAHDFNNLLSVILANAELLADTAEDAETQAPAAQVVQAAERGAELVRSLLAFARRQPLAPRALASASVLTELRCMLTRTLPAYIRLSVVTPDDLWPVEADPTQLQTALLNLAVNAGDAMPDGGDLVIEAENCVVDSSYAAANPDARTGEFLRLSITDSGTGMLPDVAARAFDPFFTTKPVGRGSGLGLSMVHGFVSQSGGHVTLYSEAGQGTTVRLYLPRSRQGSEAHVGSLADPAEAIPMGAGQHVVVAEDDPALRPHVARLVESLGYRVTAVADGAAALEAIRAAGDVSLLFTDVVMPGEMNGLVLAERALAHFPGLKILFTSGYSENAILRRGSLVSGARLLSKPYRRRDLGLRLHEALHEDAAPRP